MYAAFSPDVVTCKPQNFIGLEGREAASRVSRRAKPSTISKSSPGTRTLLCPQSWWGPLTRTTSEASQILKYEKVYLTVYDTIPQAREGVRKWMHFYNHRRKHQALDRKTPDVMYYESNGREAARGLQPESTPSTIHLINRIQSPNNGVNYCERLIRTNEEWRFTKVYSPTFLRRHQ